VRRLRVTRRRRVRRETDAETAAFPPDRSGRDTAADVTLSRIDEVLAES
jgi:hypothetical protein